ncbi:ATP-binding protein [Saccharomonospora sp. NPDC046836]|uniref:ATP-binding protein n=1 Tax=Saccharomonospora sp. NPDC046836 TaxID=3156921 RepID=UPI0033FCB0D2
MPTQQLTSWTGLSWGGPVELRVPAEARQLAMIRTVAQCVARQEGFGQDEATDVVVAVDEAAGCLIGASVPGAILTCRYVLALGKLQVVVSTTTRAGSVPGSHAFGWRVLTTMTDSLSVWRFEHDGQRSVDRIVHIEFAKQFVPGRL